MQMVALTAAARSSGLSAKQLRRSGKVPAVVYGNIENTQIQCDENVLRKAFVQAGESTLVDLDIEGKKVPVLFHTIDFDPVSDRFAHVDFYAVNMKEELETHVSLRFEGEAPAVKELSAILVTALDTVTVRCLPSNLPHDLPVDLGKLVEFGATLTVADIKVPSGVTILEDPDTVIMVAQQPREEEKEEVVAAAPVEGAEGAPAAEGAAAPAEGEAAKKEGE
jgi:large subunit ribosomal protein L25